MGKRTFDHWQVAYRMKGEENFSLIDNPSWGWAADPFPIVYKGELYVFAELFLYKSERNGVIGYCKYGDGRFSEWQVSMDRHWHLSYPNVWIHNDELYMCPESYQADEVAIYRLIELPDQWEKIQVLLNNGKYVDTTFFEDRGQKYMFTFKPTFQGCGGALYLYLIKEENVSDPRLITEDVGKARPGGKVFTRRGKQIRVSQNCTDGYGCGLVFSVIDEVFPDYQEREIKKIFVADIPGIVHGMYTGIHTYNCIDELEVIDLKFERFTLAEYFARKRVRKVFVKKFG